MRILNLITIGAFFALALNSCGSSQIEKPVESYLPSNIAPAVSELPVVAEIDIKKLESSVNNKINGLLFDGKNLTDRDLSVKIWKAGNFMFSITNNVIEYRLPLKIWAKFSWKVEKFGLSVSDDYEVNGSIALIYKTSVYIGKDWKLMSTTEPAGYQWLQTPKLSIIGVNVPVTPIANVALSYGNDVIIKQIDNALSQYVDLKKYISEVWETSQKPALLSPDNNLWLKITPKDIYVAPFTTKGNTLNISMALYAQVESVIGSEPAPPTITPLPEFKKIVRMPQQFNLNLAADVTYAQISEFAKKQVVGKTFKEGTRSITINDLSIYSSEGKAIFEADVAGSLKGKIYFTGKMAYNAETKSLEIIEPDFDIKTKNVLVKSANWLLHGTILKKIEPMLKYPVEANLEQVKAEANKMLSEYSVYDGITLSGSLNNISVTDVNMVPGAVRLKANLKGNVVVKIGSLKF